MSLRAYIKHVLIGEAVVLDEAGNVFALDGDAHVTISGHCGSQIAAKRPCLFCRVVCAVLGHFWPNHCERAWTAEQPVYTASKNLPGG